jgi:hypothetical protein
MIISKYENQIVSDSKKFYEVPEPGMKSHLTFLITRTCQIVKKVIVLPVKKK